MRDSYNNKLKNDKRNLFVAKAMIIFITLQPLLDLITTYTRVVLGSNITPGMVIRFAVLAIGAIYIIIRSLEKPNKKYFLYLILLALFFIINLIISYIYKPEFSLMRELTAVGKLVYVIEMFVVYILVFKDLKKVNLINKYFPLNIIISQIITNAVMIISAVTETGIEAYDGVLKSGNSGWFYAANELGTLAAICFPVLLWMALRQKEFRNRVISWVAVITSTYTLLTIGTKVGYLAIILTLIMAVITLIVEAIVNFRKSEKINYRNIASIVLFSAVFTLGTPLYPVAQNTNSHVELINSKEPLIDEATNEPIEENKSEIFTQVIYSSRDVFQDDFVTQYDKANVWQKVFGLGFAGNYVGTPKIIERDFHDIFYQYGILGFVLIMIPVFYYGIQLVIKMLKDLTNQFKIKYVMLLSALAIGFGVAFIAGHSLMAPAVSSYIALLFGYLVVDLKIE